MITSSDGVDNIEDTNDTVSASHGEHVTLVAEVYGKAGATEILDLGARPEIVVSIKDLDLVVAGSSRND